MANKRITDRGLLIYYTSYDEISKIDSAQLGNLIKKELAWMSGKTDEPTFDDVRCDILHMHLKEQIAVRDMAALNHSGEQQGKVSKENYEIDLERARELFKNNGSKGGRPKNEQDGFKEWLNDIEREKGGSAYTAFESSWREFFPDRDTAKVFVENEMIKRRKHIAI